MTQSDALQIISAQYIREKLISNLDCAFGSRSAWCGIDDNGEFYCDVGTSHWFKAIRITCFETGHEELYKWYAELSWRESDKFDALIVDCLLGIAPFSYQ